MKIDKVKILEYLPAIAVISMCIGALFIGLVIGGVLTRNESNFERQILIDNHVLTLEAKDQLIELLAKSTVASTDAVLAQTELTVGKVQTTVELAAKEAEANRKRAEAAEKQRQAQARMLRELK